MAKFSAQNTDAENLKPVPSVTTRDKVRLLSSRSAQAIAQDDQRDTSDTRPALPDAYIKYADRPENGATTATLTSKFAK